MAKSAAAPDPVARYDLDVTVNLARPSLAVRGMVTFAVTERSRDSVEVLLHQTMGRPTWGLRLPGGNPPRFVLHTDTSEGTVSYIFRYARPLAVGALVKLEFACEGGQKSAFQLALDSAYCMAGGYGAAWYPQVVNRQPDKSGIVAEGVGKLAVAVPAGFTPVLAGSRHEPPLRRAGRPHTTHFRYEQPVVFALYVGRYQRTEYRAGSCPLAAYRLRADTATATYLRRCAAVLEALSEEFCPYPYDDFTLLEFPERISQQQGIGGASVKAGIVMPSSALDGRFNYALFGHELGHQWWGNLLRSTGKKGNGLLTEGMAQFGSLQVVKRFDPAQAEAYRRTGYPGYVSDQSGLGYLLNAASGNDAPLADLDHKNSHALGDSKGFLVLELLSETIGKPQMRVALRAICRRYAHAPLPWSGFLAEIQQAAGQDLGWFYNQWFDRLGAPEWQLSWQQTGDALDLTIVQTAPYYQLAVELLVAGATPAQTTRQIVAVPAQATTRLRVPVNFQVQQAELDPHFQVLHWAPAYKAQALALAPAQQVLNLRREGELDEARQRGEKAFTQLAQPDLFGKEFLLCYHLGRVFMLQDKPAEALAYLQRAVKCSSRDKQLLAYAYYRIAELARKSQDAALYKWAFEQAVTADALNDNRDNIAKLPRAFR